MATLGNMVEPVAPGSKEVQKRLYQERVNMVVQDIRRLAEDEGISATIRQDAIKYIRRVLSEYQF